MTNDKKKLKKQKLATNLFPFETRMSTIRLQLLLPFLFKNYWTHASLNTVLLLHSGSVALTEMKNRALPPLKENTQSARKPREEKSGECLIFSGRTEENRKAAAFLSTVVKDQHTARVGVPAAFPQRLSCRRKLN